MNGDERSRTAILALRRLRAPITPRPQSCLRTFFSVRSLNYEILFNRMVLTIIRLSLSIISNEVDFCQTKSR